MIIFTKPTSPIGIQIDENGTSWALMGYEDEILDADQCSELIEALTKAREAIREQYGKIR